MKSDMDDDFKLKIKGDALVCIDWANVHGWQKRLGWKIDATKLIKYFKSYQEIKNIKFYFGTDITNESKDFILLIKRLENGIFKVVTKNVKYVPVETINTGKEDGKAQKLRRKCDFDVEITRDALNNISSFRTLILICGDGDYAPLIDDLIQKGRNAILIFAPGHKGKEYSDFKQGLFLCSVKKIRQFIDKSKSRKITLPGVI